MVRYARPAPPAGGRDAALGRRSTSRADCACCRLPPRYDFRELRLDAGQVRARLARAGHANVVAFQTRNPLHRVHEELTKRAIDGRRRHAAAAPERRHDQAGRRRPLHPRARRTARWPSTTTTTIGSCSRCCRWPCAWPARARRSGTRSSAATTAPTTSSSGRDHASPGKDSTGTAVLRARTTRKRWSRSTQAELGVRDGAVPGAAVPARRGPLRGGRPHPDRRAHRQRSRARRCATST